MLPEQFFEPYVDERGRGVRALMVAVLEDAIDRFAGRRSARQGSRRKLAREAERWIRSEDRQWPFSFNNICFELGLDASRLREEILKRPWNPDEGANGPRARPPARERASSTRATDRQEPGRPDGLLRSGGRS